jgi:hypothetical protein
MATKKQRRRRQKERRHEYEYVYVDNEGREVEVEDAVDDPKKNGQGAAAKPLRTKAGRKIDPPSWRRVVRRGAIFAPIMAIVVYLLQGKDKSIAAALLQTGLLLLLFIPFSYVMDSLMYRSFRKRMGAKDGKNAASR